MSRKKTILELDPPGKRIYREVITTPPVTCPYCNGQGGFPRRDASGDYMERCPDCDGAGEVQATVTIDWKPYKTED